MPITAPTPDVDPVPDGTRDRSENKRLDKEDRGCKDREDQCSSDTSPSLSEKGWHFLPYGLLYESYMAGEKEPRLGAVWFYETGVGWLWEAAMGGRFPMVRYGTDDAIHPEGFQMDLEGAAFTRVDIGEGTNVDAIDFRVGMVMTWRSGNTALKGGFYHISSHVGDEFLERNPDFRRIEYVRDSLVAGITQNLNDDVSVYGEVGYAYGTRGGAEPLEFQFGAQYDPSGTGGWRGTPFAAINGHLREDFDFDGTVNMVAGWQWPSAESGRVVRWGVQYHKGQALQYSFFDKDEELFGIGVWFDF